MCLLGNAGEILNVFMSIFVGSFSLGFMPPELQGEQPREFIIIILFLIEREH